MFIDSNNNYNNKMIGITQDGGLWRLSCPDML